MAAAGKWSRRFICGSPFRRRGQGWSNAIRLNGSSAAREAEFGEAQVAAANDVVTADAKAAFARALGARRAERDGAFYMGMAADQDGRRADAEKIWHELLADAPPGAPWAEFVRQALARNAPPAVQAPGPSAGDIAAAGQMNAKTAIK